MGVVCAMLVVLLGPRVTVDESISPVEVPEDVDTWLAQREASVVNLRPEAEKEVVWADSVGRRTPLAVVYVHGFSADRHEIDPVPRIIADSLGANLFYTRFTGHGRDGAGMADATPQAWFQDMAEALAVGRRLGERVVLVGSSTGATLATWTAGNPELGSDVAGLVLLSPNFRPRDGTARILLWPWGGAIARLLTGGERCWDAWNEAQEQHWTTCYPSQALLPMMGLVERVRTMDLGTVQVPTLVLYATDDEVVDPRATEELFPEIGGTPKRLVPFRESRDPSRHILAGDILSPESNDAVVGEVLAFLELAEIR